MIHGQEKLNKSLDKLIFALNLTDVDIRKLKSRTNPKAVEDFIESVKEQCTGNLAALKQVDKITRLLQAHHDMPMPLSDRQLRAVYVALKERRLHPRGYFDKMGRFFVEDEELVDVMPSERHPFKQMSAARTPRFVRALAQKYKPQDEKALKLLFVSPLTCAI